MQKSRSIAGSSFAAAAALMFTVAPLTAANAADAAKIKCDGANGCKGQSSCHTATSGCQGQNSCKHKGYLMLSKAECDSAKAKMKSEKK